jgi:hypothetical protein
VSLSALLAGASFRSCVGSDSACWLAGRFVPAINLARLAGRIVSFSESEVRAPVESTGGIGRRSILSGPVVVVVVCPVRTPPLVLDDPWSFPPLVPTTAHRIGHCSVGFVGRYPLRVLPFPFRRNSHSSIDSRFRRTSRRSRISWLSMFASPLNVVRVSPSGCESTAF